MVTCSGCGKQIENAHYHNGIPYCTICLSLVQTTESQCANCGMYLPITEMKMWASRYYCNYCIMDVLDEEERLKKQEKFVPDENIKEKSWHAGQTKGVFDNKQDSFHSETGDKRIPKTCNLCGRTVDFLYNVRGRMLCEFCKDDFSGDEDFFQTKPHGVSLFIESIRHKITEKLSNRKKPIHNKGSVEKNTKSTIASQQNNESVRESSSIKKIRLENLLKKLKNEKEQLTKEKRSKKEK